MATSDSELFVLTQEFARLTEKLETLQNNKDEQQSRLDVVQARLAALNINIDVTRSDLRAVRVALKDAA
jgi:peptidoglycan hydrolase CwlO-like protein